MKNPKSLHRRSAYTLTEILVVIGIIGILAGLSFVVFKAASKTADKYEAIAQTAKDHLAAPNASAKRVAMKSLHGSAKPKKPSQPKTNVPSAVPEEYIVTFTPEIADARAEAQRLATRYGGTVLSVYTPMLNACALKIPDKQFAAFRAAPAIATVDKNFKVYVSQQQTPTGVRRTFSYPNVPPSQLILQPIKHQSRRNIIFKGPTAGYEMVNVAVIDSGIDSSHPDLNVVMSVPFGNLPDGEDENGHGTHVAGIIGAMDNDIGVVGVYPGAPLWSLRIFDATGAGTTALSLDALKFVFNHANVIRVCNMSYGGPVVSLAENMAVDNCVRAGVVMVASAGNDAKPASGYGPASASLVICVAALADSDGRPGALGPVTSAGPDDTFATFSNFDSTVTVIAPGVDILSTLPGGYGVNSGTSMAAPHVSGICALMLDPTTIFGKNNRNLLFPFRPGDPTTMRSYLRTIATERIPGINGDPLSYPMVNFRVQ